MRYRSMGLLLGLVLLVPVPSQGAALWADRGWVEDGMTKDGMTYKNTKHGLRLVAPPMWTIEHAEKFDAKFLWSMKKFDNSGNILAGVSIIACCPVNPAQAEQSTTTTWPPSSNSQRTFRLSPPVRPNAPGMYEIQFITTDNKLRGRSVFFVRNGTGDIVGFVWAANASRADLAELDSVRRVMGLPQAKAASPGGPRLGHERVRAPLTEQALVFL